MAKYELSYEFLFSWAGFSGVKAKRVDVFEGEDDADANEKALEFIAEKNQQKSDNGYDFSLIRLVRIIQ